jgi:preprotein translocase subunit SecF
MSNDAAISHTYFFIVLSITTISGINESGMLSAPLIHTTNKNNKNKKKKKKKKLK